MVASIIRVSSALNFPMNQILICNHRLQIFELFHIFIRSNSYLHVTILSCTLVRGQKHTPRQLELMCSLL
jgi:hypothetical protein